MKFIIAMIVLAATLFPSLGVPQVIKSKGLILQPDEGEKRVRRWGYPIIIKVDALNGGSKYLTAGTEDIQPGKSIPIHKHANADEIVIIERGTALATMEDKKEVVKAGAMAYGPHGTWMGFKNIGTDTLRVVWIFSRPGFETYVRATSVPQGQKVTPLLPHELSHIRNKYKDDIILRDQDIPDYRPSAVTP